MFEDKIPACMVVAEAVEQNERRAVAFIDFNRKSVCCHGSNASGKNTAYLYRKVEVRIVDHET